MVSLKHGMHGNELDPGSRTYCKTWPILAPSILAFISPYVSLSLDYLYPSIHLIIFLSPHWRELVRGKRIEGQPAFGERSWHGTYLSFKPPFFFGYICSLEKMGSFPLKQMGGFPYAQGHQDDLRLGPALHGVSPSCLQYLHGGGGPMFQEGAMETMGEGGWIFGSCLILNGYHEENRSGDYQCFFSLMLVDV